MRTATALSVIPLAATAALLPQPTPPPASAAAIALSNHFNISPEQAQTRLANQEQAHRVASTLPQEINHAGFWFDPDTGKLTVAVTTSDDAHEVETAGAIPKKVSRTKAQLDEIEAQIQAAELPGIYGYGQDPITNTIHVRVDRTAKTATTDQFLSGMHGVTITEQAGRPQQQDGQTQPGNPWWPGSETYNCSVGFSATDADNGNHFVTAGHCTNDPDQPAYGEAMQANKIGTSNQDGTHSVNEREGDMGVVAVTEPGWDLSAEVNTWGGDPITVAGSVEAIVGDAVCHTGNTAPNFECGTVSAVNQTIDYGDVVVEGLTTTDACSQGGDSGGGWLVGDKATGMHSGGYSTCSSPPTEDQSIFQPVNEALTKWGLTVYTG